MNRWIVAVLLTTSLGAGAQTPYPNRQTTEEECLGLIAVLRTFEIPEMKTYFEKNRDVSGREVAEKIRSLGDSGDKTAMFIYSALLLGGYCVPQDFCAARKYREKSRGGATDWELIYPIPPFLKKRESETVCN